MRVKKVVTTLTSAGKICRSSLRRLDHFKGFMLKRLEDNFVLIYCFILFNLAFLFLGSEISTIQHDAELRQAQHTVEKCQVLITRGEMYK